MKLGGLQKLTIIDYPEHVACTVFVIGCNFRCPFCYNPELLDANVEPLHSEKEFFDFLEERKGFLDAVCVCGGEPTIHPDLPDFIKKIKELGYLVKLDTNGSNPEMLEKLVKERLVDYVALDVKATKQNYFKTVGLEIDFKNIERSILILKASKIDYEFRTTVVPTLHTKQDIVKIASMLAPAKKYFLQNFQPQTTLDPALTKIEPYTETFLEEIRQEIKHNFEVCGIR